LGSKQPLNQHGYTGRTKHVLISDSIGNFLVICFILVQRQQSEFNWYAREKVMLKYLIKQLDRLAPRKEKGQDLAEYSLFLGLIALVVVISITLIGTQISDIFIAIATAITNGL
jgi:Flp pilus assembly pilin Flp